MEVNAGEKWDHSSRHSTAQSPQNLLPGRLQAVQSHITTENMLILLVAGELLHEEIESPTQRGILMSLFRSASRFFGVRFVLRTLASCDVMLHDLSSRTVDRIIEWHTGRRKNLK